VCISLEKALIAMSKLEENSYSDELRQTRSVLVVSELQRRYDVFARELVEKYSAEPSFEPLHDYMIDKAAWNYVRKELGVRMHFVFCHPDILCAQPRTSLYYRGLCGLSIKAAKDYFGSIEKMESLEKPTPPKRVKAEKMARVYNTFISSIVLNTAQWTLENGYRTILATIGITLDGVMRNRVGSVAEERIRGMILSWLYDNDLVVDPVQRPGATPKLVVLKTGVEMNFGSEPDISFSKDGKLLATVEIKGGIDPAGALERYGAAKKSFEHAVREAKQCRNFYLGGVFTPELQRRIDEDRLVEKTYNIIELLSKEEKKAHFFQELFHHTLRIS